MATTKRTAEVLLRFKVVKGDISTALQGVTTLEGSIESVGGEITKTRSKTEAATDSLQELGSTASGLSRGMKKGAGEIDGLGDAAASAENKVDSLQRELDDLDRTSSQIRSNVGGLGDIDTGVQTLAGGLRTAGAGGAADILSGGGEIFAVAEGVTQLSAASKGAIPALKAVGTELASSLKNVTGAIGGAGVGLIGATVALAAVYLIAAKRAEEAKKATDAFFAAEREFFDLRESSTTESIDAQLDALRGQLTAARAFQNQTQQIVTQTNEGLRQALTPVGAAFVNFGIAIGVTGGEVKSARQQLEATNLEIRELEESESALLRVRDSVATATNDLAAAEAQRVGEITRLAQIERRANQLAIDGTSEQLDARLKAIDLERQSIESQLTKLAELDQENETVIERTGELNEAMRDLATEEELLTSTARKAIAVREEQIAVEEQLTEAILANEEKMKGLATATQKFNDDIVRIREGAAKEELRIAQRFAAAQVRIAQSAAEAAQRALDNLERQQDKLRTSLSRGEDDARIEAQDDALDARIEFQRDEVKAARDHAKRLVDIRKRASQDEQELALNRDFAGIARLRRQTGQQLSEENQRAVEEREERLREFEQENEDRQRQFIRERRDRLRKFRQDLLDARQQFQRELRLIAQKRQAELALLRQAHVLELRMLNQKLSAEIQMRQQAIRQELAIISQGAQARLAMEAAIQNQFIQQAQAILSSATASFTAQRTTFNTTNSNNTITQQNTFQTGTSARQVQRLVDEGFRDLFR